MVNPSNSDSKIPPPKPSNVQGGVGKAKPPPYSRKDFKQTMRDEGDRLARQGQEKAAREKKERLRGSPMSLAKHHQHTGEKGRKTDKSADERDKIQEEADAEMLAQKEEEEAQASQAQAKAAQAKAEQKAPNSPFALFQKGTKEKGGATTLASLEKGSQGKEKPSVQARTDQSGVNPMGGPASSPASVGTSIESKQQASVAEIQALVDQLVEKLYTVKQGQELTTVIVLKQPPIFEGASLRIIGYASAGKEFNLTFENLRPDAKALLDNNLQALRTNLTDKGIVQAVHVITTTTQIENLPGAAGQPPRDQRDEQQQRQDRQRDQQPDDEEG